MKRTVLCVISCVLLGTGIFFVVNHAARAQLIVAAVGELPYIPGCPLHESCVKALQEGHSVFAPPMFPATVSGSIAAVGAMLLLGAAFLLLSGKRKRVMA
jgi:2-keto-3-deoxy-6-phosphogluconate aldolase